LPVPKLLCNYSRDSKTLTPEGLVKTWLDGERTTNRAAHTSSEEVATMSDDERSANQSGGVNIGSSNVTVGGDIVGHDKIVDSQISDVQLTNIFRPLMGALKSAPP